MRKTSNPNSMFRFLAVVTLFLSAAPAWAGPVIDIPDSNVIPEMRNGTEVRYWPNGRLASRTQVALGTLDGIAEKWWEDGTLQSRRKFRRGVLVDTCIDWNGNGHMSEFSIYEDGNPIWTQSFNSSGLQTFFSFKIQDSTYRTLRWDGKGKLTKDTLEIYPVIRIRMKP